MRVDSWWCLLTWLCLSEVCSSRLTARVSLLSCPLLLARSYSRCSIWRRCDLHWPTVCSYGDVAAIIAFWLGFEIITWVKNKRSAVGGVTVTEGPVVPIFSVEEWGNIRFILPWRWRQTFSPKCCYRFTKLHDVLFQKNVAFVGCTLYSYKEDRMGRTCNTNGDVNTFMQSHSWKVWTEAINDCTYTYSWTADRLGRRIRNQFLRTARLFDARGAVASRWMAAWGLQENIFSANSALPFDTFWTRYCRHCHVCLDRLCSVRIAQLLVPLL